MEMVFVITHTIMAACIIGIIWIAITEINLVGERRQTFSHRLAETKKSRAFRFSTISVYRITASLLAFFIR